MGGEERGGEGEKTPKTDAMPKALMDLGRHRTFLFVNHPKREVFNEHCVHILGRFGRHQQLQDLQSEKFPKKDF